MSPKRKLKKAWRRRQRAHRQCYVAYMGETERWAYPDHSRKMAREHAAQSEAIGRGIALLCATPNRNIRKLLSPETVPADGMQEWLRGEASNP